jgi:hypothetical protein
VTPLDLTYLIALLAAALLMAAPALLRHRAINSTESLMRDFCVAPTRAKEATILHLLTKHSVAREEIDGDTYARWLNIRLAMDRISAFRSS